MRLKTLHITGPSAAFVGYRRYTGDFEVGPLQEHRQGAQIVNVAANVRVQVNFPRATGVLVRNLAAIVLPSA